MADNYLEKRYEEVFGKGASNRASVPAKPSLDTLLLRNRSYRGYDMSYVVHPLQLKAIISVNTRIASAGNGQKLRFRMVIKGPEADFVLSVVHLGAALPELALPLPGTQPESFIIVCATIEENALIDVDLGISLQSMSLKAVELGLGCVMIRNFDKVALRKGLNLKYNPIAVLAVGKPYEKIAIDTVHEGDSLKYYRENGVHHVPKLALDELIMD